MPAFLAASASRLPTSAACSVLSPLNDFGRSSHDEAASVLPASSSMSWAKMPRFERKTSRRGRSAVPRILPRTRRWRRSRASRVVKVLGTLTNLSADVLALVANALALVRLGRAYLPDLGGRLADHLLVDAAHDDLRRHRHLERDALARLDLHRVRVADLQLEVGARERGAVADALNLEALLEAVRHALDHVRDQRARETVQRAILAALGRARHGDRAVLGRDLHPLRDLLAQLALRPGHGHAARVDRDDDAGGDFDGLSADTTHALLPDVAEDFAADALGLGGAARDDAARGGHDRDAHAAEHALAARLAGVDPPARLGHALETAEHTLTAAPVLQLDDERRVRAGFRHVVVADVALLLEDAGNLDLELGGRHLGAVLQRLVGVADAREHVGDGIGEHLLSPTRSSSSCRGSRPGGRAPAGRSGRVRTS